MTIYIVSYGDYDGEEVRGVFTNKSVAEKCYKYEQMLVDIDRADGYDYGRGVAFDEYELSDDVDFDAKIAELLENERKKVQEKENAIKEADLVEFNRIKEKYGL